MSSIVKIAILVGMDQNSPPVELKKKSFKLSVKEKKIRIKCTPNKPQVPLKDKNTWQAPPCCPQGTVFNGALSWTLALEKQLASSFFLIQGLPTVFLHIFASLERGAYWGMKSPVPDE